MPTDISKLRVALVHDWLVSSRGGERVLEALCELFPQAELFTLVHRPGSASPAIEKRLIHTSFLNSLPGAKRHYRHLLPLMPLAIEQLRLDGFDLVISSSHCVAKGVIPDPQALHLCYCHTTMRYAWDQSHQYFSPWMRAMLSPFLHYLRMWDVSSSMRVDHFVANSRFVASRVNKYYRRESDIVNPFVDLERFRPGHGERGNYYLVVSAFAPYKRLELAIDACRKLGRRLLIAGDGQEKDRLHRLGGGNIEFLGILPDSELPDLYAGARALLFPGVEDFGITPLEAMASGVPVIAFAGGGALETVADGKSGMFFRQQTSESLAAAIERFEAIESSFTQQACREQAMFFSKTRFQNQLLGIVGRLVEQKRQTDEPRKTRQPDLYLG